MSFGNSNANNIENKLIPTYLYENLTQDIII